MTFSIDNPDGVPTTPLWKICLEKMLWRTRVKSADSGLSQMLWIFSKCIYICTLLVGDFRSEWSLWGHCTLSLFNTLGISMWILTHFDKILCTWCMGVSQLSQSIWISHSPCGRLKKPSIEGVWTSNGRTCYCKSPGGGGGHSSVML